MNVSHGEVLFEETALLGLRTPQNTGTKIQAYKVRRKLTTQPHGTFCDPCSPSLITVCVCRSVRWRDKKPFAELTQLRVKFIVVQHQPPRNISTRLKNWQGSPLRFCASRALSCNGLIILLMFIENGKDMETTISQPRGHPCTAQSSAASACVRRSWSVSRCSAMNSITQTHE